MLISNAQCFSFFLLSCMIMEFGCGTVSLLKMTKITEGSNKHKLLFY